MSIPEIVAAVGEYGIAGLVILAVTWAVLTDRLFFRREVDEWRRRYEERGQQLDAMTTLAQDSTRVASESATMLQEILIIVRARMQGTGK